MTDPVILGNTGDTFERTALVDWLKNNDTHPITKEKLDPSDMNLLIPNKVLATLIQKYKNNIKEQPPSTIELQYRS